MQQADKEIFKKNNLVRLNVTVLLLCCFARGLEVLNLPVFFVFIVLFIGIQSFEIYRDGGLKGKERVFFLLVPLNFSLMLLLDSPSLRAICHSVALPLTLLSLVWFFKKDENTEKFNRALKIIFYPILILMWISIAVGFFKDNSLALESLNSIFQKFNPPLQLKIVTLAHPFSLFNLEIDGYRSIELLTIITFMAMALLESKTLKWPGLILLFALILFLRSRSNFLILSLYMGISFFRNYLDKEKIKKIIVVTLLVLPAIAMPFLSEKILNGRQISKKIFLEEFSLLPNGAGYSEKILEHRTTYSEENPIIQHVFRVFDNVHFEVITDYGFILYLALISLVILWFWNNSMYLFSPIIVLVGILMCMNFSLAFYPMHVFIVYFIYSFRIFSENRVDSRIYEKN